MAIIDSQLVFAQSQSLIATAPATTNSTNIFDSTPGNASTAVVAGGNQNRQWGVGEQLYLHILCTTAIVQASTNGTLNISLVSSAATNLGTPTVHWLSQTFTDGVSANYDFTVVGARIDIPVPQFGTYLRYLGFQYSVATQDTSAGAVTIWIDRAQSSPPPGFYASGLNW